MIHFTFAQIEAFITVCATNNVSKAANKLNKNRTTISELISLLEINLGYDLFIRAKKPLELTPEGKQLYVQACLFLQQANIFDQFAMQLPNQVKQSLTICYDCFTPQSFIEKLINHFSQQQIALNLLNVERLHAEKLILEDKADIGIYPAINRIINTDFMWRAIGTIELGLYANKYFFAIAPNKISILELASTKQLIPFSELSVQLSQMIKISDKLQKITDIELLKQCLNNKQGWSFLPTHLFATAYNDVQRFDTELWDKGAVLNIVAICKPNINHQLQQVIEQITHLYS